MNTSSSTSNDSGYYLISVNSYLVVPLESFQGRVLFQHFPEPRIKVPLALGEFVGLIVGPNIVLHLIAALTHLKAVGFKAGPIVLAAVVKLLQFGHCLSFRGISYKII